MKAVRGWRKIDNKRGYVNEETGESLVVTRKEFWEAYMIMLFPLVKNADEKGRKISPDYATESKAEAFAMNWMSKHPKGAEQALASVADEGGVC
jgi:hypothetical protein